MKIAQSIFYTLLALFLIGKAEEARAQEAPATDPTTFFGTPFVPQASSYSRSYSFFDPTPEDELRPLNTDRPGKTHGTTTVDPGHFQVESDLAVYSFDTYSPQHEKTQTLNVGTPILKAGISDNVDLEAAFSFYNQNRVTDKTTGASQYGNGFGDVWLGGKIHLAGGDEERQSLAILPFVKIPSSADNTGNSTYEYQLNVPYNVNLDSLWSLTLEPDFSLLRDITSDGLHGDYVFSANLSRPVFVPSVIAAVELSSEYDDNEQATPRYSLDPSIQWVVNNSLQLDTGTYIGLDKAAPDYVVYTGVSFRY